METKIDLFTTIHKAVRGMLYDTARKLQQVDPTDKDEVAQMLTDLEDAISFMEEHGKHEDDTVFPPIEAAIPGSTLEAESQHRGYDERLHLLIDHIQLVKRCTDTTERIGLLNILNRKFIDFMAYFLIHMNTEEEIVLPASQNALSNEQLLMLRQKVQSNIEPARYQRWLSWMLPALSLYELGNLFNEIKAAAPPHIFENVKAAGQKYLPEERWLKLSQSMEK